MKAHPCVTALVLALAIPPGAATAQDYSATGDHPIRLAQTTTITPVPPQRSTSATCMSACSVQQQSCQGTCIGTTSPSGMCISNCSSQATQCQRSCVLGQ